MPSYGSLQQAVKVRPRRGEKPHEFVDLCLQVEYFAFCGMKLIFTLNLSCKAHLHLSHINASETQSTPILTAKFPTWLVESSPVAS